MKMEDISTVGLSGFSGVILVHLEDPPIDI